MVKNTKGGSGQKKFARKNTGGSKNNRLRISEDEGEIYAIVTKMLGNGMFHCFCTDGASRLGHIRGKFTGRGKRDNMVEGGKWVLIGLREWDVPSEKSTCAISKPKDKTQKCDLLEVYSDLDKHRLRESVSEDWHLLDNNDVSKNNKDAIVEDDTFVFGTDRDFEREKLIGEMKSATIETITFTIGEKKAGEKKEDEQEEEVNFDDI
jgi:translation initiation factor 1A